MSSKLQDDLARKIWQDMMKEGTVEVNRDGGGDRNPKMETEDSVLVVVN